MRKYIYLLLFILTACKDKITPEPETVDKVSIIKISNTQNVLEIDEEVILTVDLIKGEDITLNITAIWESSNISIGEIIAPNTLKIKTEGIFKVFASYNGLKDSLTINAISKDNLAKEIFIQASDLEIAKNGTSTFIVEILDKNSNTIELENTAWHVTDTTIGTINTEGLFTPKKAGFTNIYVESNGLISENIEISIYREGTFSGKEGHSSNGNVKMVYRNGQLIIETQDNFNVQSGPDLRVFLSNIENGSRINTDALELSLLKSNSGKRTYVVPRGIEINTYNYVNVHCKQYNTTFGSARFN